MYSQFGKILIFLGGIFVFLGILFLLKEKIPILGKLPGDFTIKSKNFTVFLPLATCILLSVIISIAINIFKGK
jgi:hypothetical protein